MRVKKMDIAEYQEILARNLTPVRIDEGSLPEWMTNIPKELIHGVYASGTLSRESGILLDDSPVPSGTVIGGMDVYRKVPGESKKEGETDLNKDWYPVIKLPGEEGKLVVAGPYRDIEHWVDEVPSRLEGAEVVLIPPKNQAAN